MAADGGQLRPLGMPGITSLLKRLVGRLRVGVFPLRNGTPGGNGTGHDMPKTSEYLQVCEENAIDAHTIEDALYWHNEVITELSIELNLIHTAKWPRTVKASMAAELEDRIRLHSEAVARLAAILERNEQFNWQP